MKHEPLIRRMLSELHEPWMNDQDKSEFDAVVLELYGEQLDSDIEAGVEKGFTADQQENIVRELLKQLKEDQ